MKKYNVRVPFAGYIEVEVEATDEVIAKEIGFKVASQSMRMVELEDSEIDECFNDSEIAHYQWETYEKTTEGNVTYLECTEIEVDEI